MYEKILWWAKTHPQNPLPYDLIVASIFESKCKEPEVFYNPKMVRPLETFLDQCKTANHLAGLPNVVEEQFKAATGFSTTEIIGSEIWREIIECDSINDYIESKTFNSQREIHTLCKKIYSEYLNEPCFLNEKTMAKVYGQRGVAFSTQMRNLSRNVDSMEKWAEGTANQFWFGTNALRCISKRVDDLMNVERTPEKYREAIISLREAFNFSPLQIEMLKYFVCQSKEGNCPASLNKTIYIWGKEKQTGKTTIAATIVSILNGEKDHFQVAKYKSVLAQELQFQSFVAPKICSCRAVLLDEAAPRDTSKMYNIFKTRITSDGATVRFIHKNQVELAAKSNYVMTSNDPPWEFVADESDRRFFEFNIEKRHKKLSYAEIYDLFLNFIQQCYREREWQEWYDSMVKDTEVKGFENLNTNDIRSYIERNEFLKVISEGSSQVSIGTFYQQVAIFEKNVAKKTIINCVTELFGEPIKKSTWRKSDIVKVLTERLAKDKAMFEDGEIQSDLPF